MIPSSFPRRRWQAGLSLMELMVSITIGLVLLTGLVTYFVNASSNQRELQRSAEQIENGRYALDTITQDLHLAGFYGPYYSYTAPTALPDPCDTSAATLQTAMGLPVQGYQAGSTTAKPTPDTNCATLLSAANLAAGSDIVVIRYAEPTPVAMGATTLATETYVQSNSVSAAIQAGGGTVSCSSDAAGVAATITRKCMVPTSSDTCSATCSSGGSPAGDVRKFYVRIYFVAPCSVPASGTNGVCTGSSDDGGNPIPTLKRLELTTSGFSIVPVAEGVEYMKIEYGVDNSPTTANSNTGLIGDGVPDAYSLTPALSEFSNAVTVRVDLLVRNTSASAGYFSSKTYNMGINPVVTTSPAVTLGPFTDSYRRHVYAAETRLVNLSGRKENP